MNSVRAVATTAELVAVDTLLTVQPIYSTDAVLLTDSANRTAVSLDTRAVLALIGNLSAALANLTERSAS